MIWRILIAGFITAILCAVIKLINDEINPRRMPTDEETRKKDMELQRRFGRWD